MTKVHVNYGTVQHIRHNKPHAARNKTTRIDHLKDISGEIPQEKVALKVKVLVTIVLTFFYVSGVYWLTSYGLNDEQKLRKLSPSEHAQELYPFLHIFK